MDSATEVESTEYEEKLEEEEGAWRQISATQAAHLFEEEEAEILAAAAG
jgi:hypothetical protein